MTLRNEVVALCAAVGSRSNVVCCAVYESPRWYSTAASSGLVGCMRSKSANAATASG
jgi:hypothetical protein